MIKKESIIFFIFFLLIPGEVVFYFIKNIYSISIPVGSFSYVMAILFGGNYLIANLNKTLSVNSIIIYLNLLLLNLLVVFSIFHSTYSSYVDYIVPLKYLIYFYLGYQFINILKQQQYVRIIIAITYILTISIIIFYFIFGNTLLTDFNYFRISEPVFLLALISVISQKKTAGKFLLGILSAIALYNINSRASFYGFIFIMLIYIYKSISLKQAVLFSTLIVLLMGPTYLYIKQHKENRVFRIIGNTDNDTSLKARNEIFQEGIARIKQHWLMGRYKAETENPKAGRYLHNVLAYWSQYGLFAFLLFLAIMGLSVLQLILNKENTEIYKIILLLTIYTFSTQMFLKSHLYFFIYITLGLIVGFSEKRRVELKTKN